MRPPFALLRQFIEEGQKAALFLGPSQQMAGSIWAGVHGYALMHIDGLYPRLDLPENPEDMLSLHVQLLLRSLSQAQWLLEQTSQIIPSR